MSKTHKQSEGKPRPQVPEHERCESRSYVSHVGTSHCPNRGVLYKVVGELTHGFARVCGRHRNSLLSDGLTLEQVNSRDE